MNKNTHKLNFMKYILIVILYWPVSFKFIEFSKDRVIIASDVERDGFGIQIYRNNELVIEIFREDTNRKRTVTIYKKDIPLELMEESIEIFKKEIPWDFMD